MEIDIKDICNGCMDGELVYVCHYHQPDFSKKPLRNLKPTQVLIIDNRWLPKGKKVYYSSSHFRKSNNEGTCTGPVISPVDNTGFRSRSGTPVHACTTKAECVKSWFKQVDIHRNRHTEYAREAKADLDREQSGFARMLEEDLG